MVANDRPKQKNAGSKMNKLVLQEKANDENSDFENNNNDDEQTINVEDDHVIMVEQNDDEEPSIDFYNTPDLSNDNDDTNETPEFVASVENHVDFATQTNDSDFMFNNLFVKKDYFENFYDEYLEFKFRVQSTLEDKLLLNNSNNSENLALKNKIVHLEQEIFNLKKQNEDLKNETKSHLKIIETLTKERPFDEDNSWQVASSKRKTNQLTASTHFASNNKDGNSNRILMRNSYDLLPIENNIENLEEDEEVTFTADAGKQKTRSNRMNRSSIKNDNRYDHNNHINQMLSLST